MRSEIELDDNAPATVFVPVFTDGVIDDTVGDAMLCNTFGVDDTAWASVDCAAPAEVPVALLTAAPWVAWAAGLAIWGAALYGVTLAAAAD